MSVEELGEEQASSMRGAEHGRVQVIALDDPDPSALPEEPAAPAAQQLSKLWYRIAGRRAVAAGVLLAFAVGGLLGFGTKKEWDEVRAEVASRELVDVEITFDEIPYGAAGSVVHLAVQNRGPLPVRVLGAATEQPAVSVELRGEPEGIASGETERIDVEVNLDCSLLDFEAEVDLALRLAPANGVARTVQMGRAGVFGPFPWVGLSPDGCTAAALQPVTATYVGLAPEQEPVQPGSRRDPDSVTVLIDVNTAGLDQARELTRIEIPWTGSVRAVDPALPLVLEPDTRTRLTLTLTLPSCELAEFTAIGGELGLVAQPVGERRNSAAFDSGYGFSTLGPRFQLDVLNTMIGSCPATGAR